MGIYAEVVGNLTQDPSTKTVKVKGEERRIVEMRVFADVYKKGADDKPEQDEARSTGVNVTVWNERLGDAVREHFRKGVRVQVKGSLVLERWHDRDTGEPKSGLKMDAETVTLVPVRIEHIKFKPKRELEAAAEEGAVAEDPLAA
jgi:single-stranded DNA-binding protein